MRSRSLIWHRSVSTAAGEFTAGFTERGLKELFFPEQSAPLPETSPDSFPDFLVPQWRRTQAALDAILAGHEPEELPDFDWSAATPFQQQVWEQLLAIPMGSISSYGEIADRLGRPGGARAVGTACGANPIPVLVPCHRVVTSVGSLGGFSGGLDWKRKLLAVERVSALGALPLAASAR
jgi:O-6-methylguanine DNA methyltransferase